MGDFLVEEKFVVERKTLRDFAASVIDARLFKQTAAMAADARRGVIILEGTATSAGKLRVPREALQGALITVSVFYGLAVLRAGDAAETARLLVYLGLQAQRYANGALSRPGYRPKGKRARQLFVLQGRAGARGENARSLRISRGCGGGVGRRAGRARGNWRNHGRENTLGARGIARPLPTPGFRVARTGFSITWDIKSTAAQASDHEVTCRLENSIVPMRRASVSRRLRGSSGARASSILPCRSDMLCPLRLTCATWPTGSCHSVATSSKKLERGSGR